MVEIVALEPVAVENVSEEVMKLSAYDVDTLEKKGPRAEVLRYPAVPRPVTVEVRFAVERTPPIEIFAMIPAVVETNDKLLT
jgi:hypothetical protein